MRLEEAFRGPLENTVVVNASNGTGLFILPYRAADVPRIDCNMLEWTPSGQAVTHKYENVGTRPELNFDEWNALATKHGLAPDGWRRYVLG